MQQIILEAQSTDGKPLRAIFLPEKGMNMISYKKGDIEVIDQSTKNLFEERYAGLGALIGPHFHRRRQESIPKIKDENLFPHIAIVKAAGGTDPFSHGIARYAPWKAEATKNKLKGIITGKDTWNDIPLAQLEGQNFKMEFEATLTEKGLSIHLSIVSDTDSLVGIHYYYALPNGKGRITTHVQKQFRNEKRELVDIPSEWSFDSQHKLNFNLEQAADFTFRPYPNPLDGIILLETDLYSLRTHYRCDCEENCWQLYHPKESSFVCIEPISSQDPTHPNLSVSSLDILLEIL
ncbi:MAG: hypothetical protein H0W88_08605 [Parachlamydiaceae bacterium]|nr:hypothetical protein [Parachlamydiaceae bacterium]